MAITLVLLALVAFNFKGASRSASVFSVISTLTVDLQHQRNKSMLGIDGSRHGIYFEADKYYLFEGVQYDPDSSDNFRVDIADNIFISSVLFAGNQIIFASGSGEIVDFVQNSDKITLTESTTGSQKTLTINKLGTPVSAQ